MNTFEFRIAGYTPETIPMERLAKYLAELAKLLGNEKDVHFLKIKKEVCLRAPKWKKQFLKLSNACI
jgi:hypothetical protein